MTRDAVMAIEAHAEPNVVFDTIAGPDGLAAFWTPDVQSEGRDGGELSFGFEAVPTRLSVSVIEADAPSSIAWAFGGDWPFWAGTTAEWSLEPSESGTKVLFRHRFPEAMPEYDFGSVALTWALVVARLKDVVESPGTPNPALR
jgi:uncharacterized protein YndB with AHSA1/START domain